MFLEKVFHFIIFLGPLVFFHELGHFLFARLAGVRVEVFSIGFGPKIFKKKWGETEYAVSIIPLGGYVKMFGDNPLDETELTEEEKKVAYTHKSKWARFWIVFGGPLANFILAYLIYFFLVVSGEKVPEARLGLVAENTRYHSLGLRSGDVLKKINDSKILSFDDLNTIDTEIETIVVQRQDKTVEVPFKMNGIDFLENFSALRTGLRAPVVLDSTGKEFFLSTSETVNLTLSLENLAKLNKSEVYLFPILSKLNELKKFEDIKLDKEKQISLNLDSEKKLLAQLITLGYYPRDLIVENVVMGSPADKAKLTKGNVIVSVNGNKIVDFSGLRSEVQKTNENEKVSLGVLENGKIVIKDIVPELREANGQTIKAIGVHSGIVFLPLRMVEYRADGFFAAITSAYHRTTDGIYKTYSGFKKLILGEVSMKNLGGPLTIGKVASDSFNVGISMFLRLMAIISINLGLINLFPIPVLDGGHIVFIVLEFFNKGPLSKKKMQVAQQIGMSLLFLLIFVSLFNDFSRLF